MDSSRKGVFHEADTGLSRCRPDDLRLRAGPIRSGRRPAVHGGRRVGPRRGAIPDDRPDGGHHRDLEPGDRRPQGRPRKPDGCGDRGPHRGRRRLVQDRHRNAGRRRGEGPRRSEEPGRGLHAGKDQFRVARRARAERAGRYRGRRDLRAERRPQVDHGPGADHLRAEGRAVQQDAAGQLRAAHGPVRLQARRLRGRARWSGPAPAGRRHRPRDRDRPRERRERRRDEDLPRQRDQVHGEGARLAFPGGHGGRRLPAARYHRGPVFMAKRDLTSVVLAAALGLVCEATLARRGVIFRAVRSAESASVPTFAGNAQHTAVFLPAAQDLNTIHWSTAIDLHTEGGLAHYGAPVITSANTVLVPVKTATDGFQIGAFDGAGGGAKYTLTTDYVLPPHNWIPTYQPVLASGAPGLRLYYAGAGGTVSFIDNPDSAAHGAPVQRVFYTSPANYQANAAAFNASIFINTPLTADGSGHVFFGFRVAGTAPAPLSTTQSGFARIDASGNGTYVLAGAAANDASITRDSHNSAPALSNDESTLHVVVKAG